MTVSALVPGNVSANGVDQRANSTIINHFGELRAINSTTPGQEYYLGIRFPNAPTLVNFRWAQLQLAMNDNYNSLHVRVRGHKVANSPVFNNATRPKVRWDFEATTNYLDIDFNNVDPYKPIAVPDPDDKLEAIINEIISMPGFIPGNAITLLMQCSSAYNQDNRIIAQGNADSGPRLLLKYGPLASDAVEWQHTDVGDSMAAYLHHDGFEIANLAVVFMGTTTVGKAAAGMRNDTYGFYSGDNFRGYETPGTIERIFNERLGEINFDMFRRGYAVAGTLLAQWYGQTVNQSGGWWGDPNEKTSARYGFAHPKTPWQLVWMSFGGNDFNGIGGSLRLISEEDANASTDAVWSSYIDLFEEYLRAMVDEVYMYANPEHTYCILPGYPNFCAKKSNNPNPFILPPSGSRLTNSQDTFRAVWSLNMSIGGAQFLWDSIGLGAVGEIHQPFTNLELQSALVRAVAHWQNGVHPGDIPPGYPYNPNGAWWNYGTLQVNFPTLGPLSMTSWSYGGVNRWFESYRNVHDINVNMRMNMFDDMYARVAADYPNVLHLKAKQSMGIDTVYSHDPTSEYAQSDPLKWVEGIHPNKDGFRDWIMNPDADGTPSIMDRLIWNIPFLQKFSDKIFFEWDGTTLDPLTNGGAFEEGDLIPTYINWAKMQPA